MARYNGPERRRGTRLEQHLQSALLGFLTLVLGAGLTSVGGAVQQTVSAIPVIKSELKALHKQVDQLSGQVRELEREDG